MNSNFYHLNLITACALERARQKAKEGKKDEARDWCRYFFQSGVLDVLENGGWNVQLMRDNLQLLTDECHPNHNPVLKGDLESIADSLRILTDHIMSKPVRRGGRKMTGI